MDSKSSSEVVKSLDAIEQQMGWENFKELFKSITWDNGSEFWDVDGINKSSIHQNLIRTDSYFAHPYMNMLKY
jgi:IS30 family transposase